MVIEQFRFWFVGWLNYFKAANSFKDTYDDASELDIEPILPARYCCVDGNGNEVVLGGATSTDL